MEQTALKCCSMCKEFKDVSLFRKRSGNQKHLYKSQCNSCLYLEHKKWVENNTDKVKEYRKKDSWTLVKRCSRRGISPEELIDRYQQQEECCAICKEYVELSDSAIDHNHLTEEFRGVLCKQCNRALGMFKDSPKILRNALEYLEAFGCYGDK